MGILFVVEASGQAPVKVVQYDLPLVIKKDVEGLFYDDLYVVNRQGEIMEKYRLDSDYLPKAEGIAFSPSGDLYISSEGNGKHTGVIAKVKLTGIK